MPLGWSGAHLTTSGSSIVGGARGGADRGAQGCGARVVKCVISMPLRAMAGQGELHQAEGVLARQEGRKKVTLRVVRAHLDGVGKPAGQRICGVSVEIPLSYVHFSGNHRVHGCIQMLQTCRP